MASIIVTQKHYIKLHADDVRTAMTTLEKHIAEGPQNRADTIAPRIDTASSKPSSIQ